MEKIKNENAELEEEEEEEQIDGEPEYDETPDIPEVQ